MFRNLSAKALGIAAGQGELIELALSHGFKGVELDVLDFAEQVKANGMPKARRLLDSAKLRVQSFPLPIDWEADDDVFRRDVARMPDWLGPAAELGAKRAITYVEPASDFRPYHQNFVFHQQRLAEVARLLESSGIRLGVGFRAAGDARQGKALEFIRSIDALVLLLGMVGARNLGVVVDVWDLHASGGSLDAVRKLTAEKIIAVQLADATADAAASNWPSTARTLPGETGIVDSSAALTLLAELNYDGPVTPVPHPSRLAGMRRDAAVKAAGERIDQVWKAAGLNPAGRLAPSTTRR